MRLPGSPGVSGRSTISPIRWHCYDAKAMTDIGITRLPMLRATIFRPFFDEYVHCLVESEGLVDAEPSRRVTELSCAIGRAISLLPSQIEVDDPRVRSGRLSIDRFTIRGRFAMRLADYRDEAGSTARLNVVRDAFNSPFRPFVLATTSIGARRARFPPLLPPTLPLESAAQPGRSRATRGARTSLQGTCNSPQRGSQPRSSGTRLRYGTSGSVGSDV